MPNYSRSRINSNDIFQTILNMLSEIYGVNVKRYIYTDIIKAFGALSSMQPNSCLLAHTGTQFRNEEPFTRHNCSILLSGRDAGEMSNAGEDNSHVAESVVNLLDNMLFSQFGNHKVIIIVEAMTPIKFTDNSLESGYEIKIIIDDNGKDIA